MIKISTSYTKCMWMISQTILADGVEAGVALCHQLKENNKDCTKNCSYSGAQGKFASCVHCLEGRLRTINLYEHTPLAMDCSYLKAADALKSWSQSIERITQLSAA